METNELIASANTRNGFAIGVIRYNRKAVFAVVRMDRSSRYVTISNHTTEAAARSAANIEWAADRSVAA
jgi:translation initiation factor 2 alpha subunit (eIF-2alpha)